MSAHISYELWHDDSGNLIADFDTETDALAAVREMVDHAGAHALGPVSLLAVPEDEHAPMRLIAAGEALVALAAETASSHRV